MKCGEYCSCVGHKSVYVYHLMISGLLSRLSSGVAMDKF